MDSSMSVEDIIFQIFASITDMVKITDLTLKKKKGYLLFFISISLKCQESSTSG